MGLFSLAKEVFGASIEKQRGDTLADEMEANINHLSNASTDIRTTAVAVFLEKRGVLLSQKTHLSRDKQIEVGLQLRTTAEKGTKNCTNSDEWAKHWGLWMAGAWLESGAIKSDRAYIAHIFIENIAKDGNI